MDGISTTLKRNTYYWLDWNSLYIPFLNNTCFLFLLKLLPSKNIEPMQKTSWMKGNCEFTVYYIFPHFCGFSFVDNLAATGQGRMKWTIL